MLGLYVGELTNSVSDCGVYLGFSWWLDTLFPFKWKSNDSCNGDTHMRESRLLNKDCYKKQGKTLHNNQEFNLRRKYSSFLCIQHRSTPIYKANAAAAAARLLQSCPTLCDPIDSSPSGSPVPGILQARTLEWVSISFSNA